MTVENFIPMLWSTKFLERLRRGQVFANCVNRDYEGEIKNFGDTVKINTVGPITISDYTKNTINLTPEQIQGAGQNFQIDQAKYFYFALDDVDKAQTQGSVMEGAMDEASFGMRDATDTFLATTLAGSIASANILLSGGTPSSTVNPLVVGTGAGDADAYETLVALNTRMNLQNVPSGNRWVVVDPNFVGLLLIDPRFSSFATQGAMEVIRAGASAGGENGDALKGALSMLVGMDVYVSNNVPNTGGATPVYTIMAGYKGACTYAEQIAEGQPEAFRLQTGFADAVRGLHLYGAKVTRPDALAAVYVQYS